MEHISQALPHTSHLGATQPVSWQQSLCVAPVFGQRRGIAQKSVAGQRFGKSYFWASSYSHYTEHISQQALSTVVMLGVGAVLYVARMPIPARVACPSRAWSKSYWKSQG